MEKQKLKKEPSLYQPEPGTEHLYHVQVEKPMFDQRTGEKISTATVQLFDAKNYKSLAAVAQNQLGYTLTVLHEPTI